MKQFSLSIMALSLATGMVLGLSACATSNPKQATDNTSNEKYFFETTGLKPGTQTQYPTGEYVPSDSQMNQKPASAPSAQGAAK